MLSDITILPPGGGNDVDLIRHDADISGAVSDVDFVRLWLSGQQSAHTFELYSRIAQKLLLSLPHGLRRATVADIALFEANLKAQGQKPNSVYTTMSVVRSLFSFAQRTGYVNLSPAHVRKNRAPPHNSRNKCLTEDEVWLLIDQPPNPRDRLLMRFLYGTAVRISELLGIAWADIFVEGGIQKAQLIGKGAIYAHIPIPGWVGLIRPENATSEDFVFTCATKNDPHPWKAMSESLVRWTIRDAALRAGIKKQVSPHWFRHSAITHIQDHGVSIITARDFARHKNINTTSGYSHTIDMGVPGDVLKREK